MATVNGITNGVDAVHFSEQQTPIYLLKTKSAPTDSYEEYLSQVEDGKYWPVFVPVLEHRFRDHALRTLRRSAERFAFAGGSPATARQIATNNLAKRYGGMIFTSQRAVEAFSSVVAKLDPSKKDAMFDKDMPLYAVGPATANGLRTLGLPCPILGAETGNGEALAEFILQDYNNRNFETTHLNARKLPLLFLVGEQRRDIIPRTLQSEENLRPAQRITVTEAVAYETGEMAEFEEVFTDLLQTTRQAGAKVQWVAVFSPQGCEAMLSALGWLDPSADGGRYNRARKDVSVYKKTRVVSIGPTTKQYLLETHGFEVDACAETPSPEGVAGAIMVYEEGRL